MDALLSTHTSHHTFFHTLIHTQRVQDLRPMDWYSWLSKTGLEPSLVYEYGLSFAHNELEEDDIPYFNHEFLQSMGISIAKHRLEILKLARKESTNRSSSVIPHHFSRILIKIKRTKRCFSDYFRAWIRREESTLALVPRRSYSGRWKNSMMKRNKRSSSMVAPANKAPMLLLTNGSPAMSTAFASSRINSFSSPYVSALDRKGEDGDCDEYLSSAAEEIRWDAMFQNLKPT